MTAHSYDSSSTPHPTQTIHSARERITDAAPENNERSADSATEGDDKPVVELVTLIAP